MSKAINFGFRCLHRIIANMEGTTLEPSAAESEALRAAIDAATAAADAVVRADSAVAEAEAQGDAAAIESARAVADEARRAAEAANEMVQTIRSQEKPTPAPAAPPEPLVGDLSVGTNESGDPNADLKAAEENAEETIEELEEEIVEEERTYEVEQQETEIDTQIDQLRFAYDCLNVASDPSVLAPVYEKDPVFISIFGSDCTKWKTGLRNFLDTYDCLAIVTGTDVTGPNTENCVEITYENIDMHFTTVPEKAAAMLALKRADAMNGLDVDTESIIKGVAKTYFRVLKMGYKVVFFPITFPIKMMYRTMRAVYRIIVWDLTPGDSSNKEKAQKKNLDSLDDKKVRNMKAKTLLAKSDFQSRLNICIKTRQACDAALSAMPDNADYEGLKKKLENVGLSFDKGSDKPQLPNLKVDISGPIGDRGWTSGRDVANAYNAVVAEHEALVALVEKAHQIGKTAKNTGDKKELKKVSKLCTFGMKYHGEVLKQLASSITAVVAKA